jgi:serine/threonine protein kinase
MPPVPATPSLGKQATCCDTVLERFEQSWRDTPPADLDAHLPPPGDPGRPLALVALVQIDQEFRWKQGSGLLVEEYLQRYPELAGDRETVLSLITWEFEMRKRREPGLGISDYLARFPGFAGDLAPRLRSIVPGPLAPAGYEVLGELGKGGMGIVYLARQVALDRLVALKVIRQIDGDESLRQRFLAEARAAARLRHPHIAQVFEVGEDAGAPFFSMEYCEGGSLDRLLAGAPLPPREAARLVRTLAGAMQHAHAQAVVHRDLKPANVLLASPARQGREKDTPGANATGLANAAALARIADFGLARRLDEASQTQTGQVLGTPSYMAPEQAAGQSGTVGPAADIYALGAVLYECLTGRPPFKAATALETLMQVRCDDPVPIRVLQPGVPRDLETISLKCLLKEPARRYATA